jgi:hypothetical protein
MDRDRAETFLRLLAEAELRRAATMPAGMPGRRYPARLALAAQALMAVGAVDSGVADEIQADAGLAVAARHGRPARDTRPGRIRPAAKRASWRVVPVGQVIKTPDSGLGAELIVLAYMQSAGGARFLVAEWPSGPFTAHQIRWLDLTAAAGQPAIRIDLTRQVPVPDITVTSQAHSPGELLLDVIAARILTAAAPFTQDKPGQPATASTLPRALSDGLGHIVAALHAADALPPGSSVPRQLAGLPQHWHSMLTPGRPAQTPAAPGIWAATAAELPGLDGATIAIAGLHHGERGTIMHLLATGVTLEDDWPYARGARPLPVLWIRDNDGRWHAIRLDGLSPWGDHGTNPWTDTGMVTLSLRIIPPLDPGTAWIEISATGRSAQARATLTLSPQ